jgi:hypothetical protein
LARTQKGVGKEFSHAVGVTGAKRRQRGRAPMEIRECGFVRAPSASLEKNKAGRVIRFVGLFH